MVHFIVVVEHPNFIDATEDCVANIIYGDNNEVRILIDWRDLCKNDVDLVSAS